MVLQTQYFFICQHWNFYYWTYWGIKRYRVFFYWSPLKCLSNFFLIGPPQHCWGGPIQKNYLNILGGTSKKKHPVVWDFEEDCTQIDHCFSFIHSMDFQSYLSTKLDNAKVAKTVSTWTRHCPKVFCFI